MEYYDKMGYLDAIPESYEEKKQREGKIVEKKFKEVYKECKQRGMKCIREGNTIFIQTSVGKWKFNARESEVHLFHKNYKFRNSTVGNYHRQFVREMSMRELVRYIAGHDKVNR